MMRRREFITLLGGLATAWPIAALAQMPNSTRHIGILSPFSPSSGPSPAFQAFRQTLHGLGWIEDRNIVLDYRWAEGRADRLPALAKELAELKPDLIFSAWGTPGALAAKNATGGIPIVFAGVGDAVGVGLVASLARPGGNVTGSTFISEETIAKQLEFLKEAVPALARVAVLVNPSNPVYGPILEAAEGPAKSLRLRLQRLGVQSADDFDGVFDAAAREHADGLVVLRDPIIVLNMSRLVELAARRRLPTMYGMREFVDAGGWMSYGPDLRDMYRRAAHVVDKILRGAHPIDVPVEQATRFQLVINLKTSKALGLTVPPGLLVRADEVIE
jgi:putative tryptophan/tyrosine transport system substrate-binding protein